MISHPCKTKLPQRRGFSRERRAPLPPRPPGSDWLRREGAGPGPQSDASAGRVTWPPPPRCARGQHDPAAGHAAPSPASPPRCQRPRAGQQEPGQRRSQPRTEGWAAGCSAPSGECTPPAERARGQRECGRGVWWRQRRQRAVDARS